MIKYAITTEKASDVKKEALLNESDNLWIELRYNHIAKVIETIKERMSDIIQNSAVTKNKGQEQTITAMAAAVRELPEYQQTMNKLGQHVAIAQKVIYHHVISYHITFTLMLILFTFSLLEEFLKTHHTFFCFLYVTFFNF